MFGAADSWTTQQLVEFLAAVSDKPTVEDTWLAGVEGAASAFDAEVAALITDTGALVAIGFPAGAMPEQLLVEIARTQAPQVEIAGVGTADAAYAEVEGRPDSVLMVARAGGEGIEEEEQDLIRGMGRVLSMAVSSADAVASLRERQLLLERLSRVQRSISSRADLQSVLDSIVSGAAELTGDEVAVLRRVSPSNPGMAEIVTAIEPDQELLSRIQSTRVGVGVSGRAILEQDLVVIEDYQHSAMVNTDVSATGMQAAMAAPVFERGRIAGSLMVGTRNPGRRYSDSEREVLQAFAEHVGLALNDARAVAETIHQAFHDSLTGLPNRALFLDRLEHALARSSRNGAGVGVLYVDLDGFKTVNDSLGHAAGDELLVLVGERIGTCVRDADTAARFGGDEFAILLEDFGGERTPSRVAGRILASLEEPFQVRGRPIYVSASVGISTGAEETADHLLRNADLAMYRAKAEGKGRFETFEPHMHDEAVQRLELQVDLKRALERDEFVVHYQPIVNLERAETVGTEALVRWQHPARGLVAPGDFIPLAEESHQIVEIGNWVLDQATAQAADWRRLPRGGEFGIGINVSGVQLARDDLVDQVRRAIAISGLPAEAIVLEITETALMADTEANIARLTRLKELGVKLAVDDFGTGYSSLQYLRQYPIDILKIAKSFVDGLRGEASGKALVQAIIDLAVTFGVKVVAEGIEVPEQRERLVEMGCTLGQGFLFARPAPPAEIEQTIWRDGRLSDLSPA